MILAVGAHPDDIELGCGGTLAKSDSTKLTISGGRGTIIDQRFDAIPILDIIHLVEEFIERVQPNVVYTHYYHDLNLDHQITARAVLTACRPVSSVKTIYSFEVPSSTEWGLEPFTPNVFVDITDTFNEKMKMLEAFKNEMRDYPHPRSVEAIKALAMYRGACSGLKLAEAFYLVREIIE